MHHLTSFSQTFFSSVSHSLEHDPGSTYDRLPAAEARRLHVCAHRVDLLLGWPRRDQGKREAATARAGELGVERLPRGQLHHTIQGRVGDSEVTE